MLFQWQDLKLIHLSKITFVFLEENPMVRYALIALTLLTVGVLILRYWFSNFKHSATDDTFTSRHFNRIAGEDISATQLDLAKAYIEMDQKKEAKRILKQVAKQAKGQMRLDARQLMKTL